MMRKCLFICLALIWLLPQAALAHSKLVETLPEKDSTAQASPQEIRLSFNTKIEKISNFKLLDAGGTEVKLGDTVVEGDTMSNRPSAPLGNGDYTVKWTIVGADGHAIEGQYGFSIAVDTATEAPTIEPTPDTGITPSPNVEPTQAPSGTTEPTSTPANEASPSPAPGGERTDKGGKGAGMSPLLAIGGIILVVAAAAALLRRRRKS